jgi:two-component system, NarL family, nitrate/nitrite response regulator NarL
MGPQSAKTRKSIRVVITDSARMNCQLLAASLQTARQFRIIAWAVSAAAIRPILKQRAPEVALISPNLKEGPFSGFSLAQEIRQSYPATRTIVMLDAMDPSLVVRSFQSGARGVFSRDRSLQSLCKCIEAVGQGQIWASTNELQALIEAVATRPMFEPFSSGGTKTLTKREAEVANLVAEGLRNGQISQRLCLSTHTVKNYLYRVYEKLEISSRAELITRVLTGNATPRNFRNTRRMAG